MTTIAYHQYCNIPNMSGSYASSPVVGPLSTSQTPLQMNTHNKGVLAGKHPNPPQFYPADGSSIFAGARQQYRRTLTTQNNFGRGYRSTSNIPSTSFYSPALKRQFNMSQSTKYVAPAPSGMYLAAKKSAAIGKSSLKQTLPNNADMSYKNYNINVVNTALRSVRGGGSVSPRKKNAIVNSYASVNPLRPTYQGATPINYYYGTSPTNDLSSIFRVINQPIFLNNEDENSMNNLKINLSPNYVLKQFYKRYEDATNSLESATTRDEIENILALVNANTQGDYENFFNVLNNKLEQLQ